MTDTDPGNVNRPAMRDIAQRVGNPLFGPDGFPVTRLFNRAQGVAYTERIAAYFTGQGVVFTDLLSQETA